MCSTAVALTLAAVAAATDVLVPDHVLMGTRAFATTWGARRLQHDHNETSAGPQPFKIHFDFTYDTSTTAEMRVYLEQMLMPALEVNIRRFLQVRARAVLPASCPCAS